MPTPATYRHFARVPTPRWQKTGGVSGELLGSPARLAYGFHETDSTLDGAREHRIMP
jgi:hypothetical protein